MTVINLLILFEFRLGGRPPKGFRNEGRNLPVNLLINFRFTEIMRDQSVHQFRVHIAPVLQGFEVKILCPPVCDPEEKRSVAFRKLLGQAFRIGFQNIIPKLIAFCDIDGPHPTKR